MIGDDLAKDAVTVGARPSAALGDAEALIIVAPMAGIHLPSLSAHLLQACAREQGLSVDVLYANFWFASLVGRARYEAIFSGLLCNATLVGERLFAAAAYGLPPLGRRGAELEAELDTLWLPQCQSRIGWAELLETAALAADWAAGVAEAVATRDYAVVGCTATFQQTSASVALLARLKRLAGARQKTVIGGASCEGDMALGVASLSDGIDYVFSGQSEQTWPAFLTSLRRGELPPGRIIGGSPCLDLDRLPTPDYSEFFEQRRLFLPDLEEQAWLPFETSRGCWWGQKHHCTFCGLNASEIAFREKSPARVLEQLQQLLEAHPSRRVIMSDTAMPRSFLREVLPRLDEALPDVAIVYQLKPNLSLADVRDLARAGLSVATVGVEALSTSVLRRMNKGGSARQNIAFLRYARAVGLDAVVWFLLYDLPGDQLDGWDETLALMPLLHHLPPPQNLQSIMVARFSPYFERQAEFGIESLRPLDPFVDAFPAHARTRDLAHAFWGEYDSASRRHPEVVEALRRAVKDWGDRWQTDERPALFVSEVSPGLFVLRDTRGLEGSEEIRFIDRARARIALVGGELDSSAEVRWALDEKVAVALDARCVPLATARPELMLSLGAQDALASS